MSKIFPETLKQNGTQARKLAQRGIELLKEQKPREAIKPLRRALELAPYLEEAREALEEAMESLEWNVAHFCKKCGKLVLPHSEYPLLLIDGFCPRCGNAVNTKKEEFIAFAELAVKLILFGIFPIVAFIFCGMPHRLLNIKTLAVEVTWYALYDGLQMALTLTPIVIALLFLYNDPNANIIRNFNHYTFASLPSPFDFITAFLFFFLLVYLYCLIVLTPIVSLHKIGQWRSKEHQKKILKLSLAYVGIIGLIRVACGAIY